MNWELVFSNIETRTLLIGILKPELGILNREYINTTSSGHPRHQILLPVTWVEGDGVAALPGLRIYGRGFGAEGLVRPQGGIGFSTVERRAQGLGLYNALQGVCKHLN